MTINQELLQAYDKIRPLIQTLGAWCAVDLGRHIGVFRVHPRDVAHLSRELPYTTTIGEPDSAFGIPVERDLSVPVGWLRYGLRRLNHGDLDYEQPRIDVWLGPRCRGCHCPVGVDQESRSHNPGHFSFVCGGCAESGEASCRIDKRGTTD